jgi:hypothetical protein
MYCLIYDIVIHVIESRCSVSSNYDRKTIQIKNSTDIDNLVIEAFSIKITSNLFRLFSRAQSYKFF